MNRIFLLLSIIILLSVSTNAQERNKPSGGKPQGSGGITGTIVDKNDGKPIEYANIILYSLRDSALITGGITNLKGYFNIEEIPFGKYYVEFDFLGYNKTTISKLEINPKSTNVALGKIELSPAAELLNEVEIEAEQARVDYRLDRKVINVEKDLNAVGGSAVDVLENVPSVQTDIDGNVSIRGSSNFMVLIDGRPSPLQGSEALQQIPSSSIKSIELITNPSVKYDPDGVGGIINIILKKEKRQGINGQVSANYGSFNSYGGDLLLNVRTTKLNYFVGANLRNSTNRGNGLFEQRTFGEDTLFVIKDPTSGERSRTGYKFRGGLDYYITDNDILTISGQYGTKGFGRNIIETSETYWISDGETINPYYYMSNNVFDVGGSYYSGDINYMHKFMKKGHEIQAYAYYSADNESETNKYVETGFSDNLYDQITLLDSTRTFEKSNVNQFRGKVDYTLPLFSEGKFEAGYQFRLRKSTNEYKYQIAGINDSWQDSTELYSQYNFDRNIQSGYAIFSNVSGKFGYMVGLRSEYTNRVIHQDQNNINDSAYNSLDFFPSVHLSYKLPWDMQLMANYSRRIDRPRGHFLDPMLEVVDPYNVKQGNPMLQPEFTNSAELNMQKTFGQSFISFEAYLRQTSNKIERIKQVSTFNPEVLISTFENIGKDLSVGGEVMANINIYKWWNLNISGNLYYYELISDLEGAVEDNNTIAYGARMNQTFRIKKTNSMIQLSGFYFGPSITSQGTSAAMGMVNISVRQDFLDKRLSLTFSLRDIFNTMNHEFIYDTPQFYSFNRFDRRSPSFKFTVTYRLNDFKNRKDNDSGSDMESGDDSM